MPNYVYRGIDCPHEFEVYQSFSDDPLTECSDCGQPVRRVFQPTGLVFKGSGWYVNDSRKKDAGSNGKASATTSDTTDKPAAKAEPAATTASTKSAEPAVASTAGAAKD
jgi:putative FmdB family regulatory protein